MTEYNRLSIKGKLGRLKKLAHKALDDYGLTGSKVIFHCFETNLLYRILTAGGDKYMMRLAYPGWRKRENLESEALWLNALARESDIPVPSVIPARSGSLVLDVTDPLVPDSWNVTLFSFLPGRLLGLYLNEKNLEKMGQLFARLHIHGKAWQRPGEFSQARFDHYLSRGEEEALFSQEILAPLPREKVEILYAARDRVEKEYSRLDEGDLRVIHCDLWHNNIKLYRGNLLPFDFEDTILGYRLHDIAMAMLDLLEDTDRVRYPVLLDAFKGGYSTLLDWPEGNMEVLQAGRILWQLNWMANYCPQGFEEKLNGILSLLCQLIPQ